MNAFECIETFYIALRQQRKAKSSLKKRETFQETILTFYESNLRKELWLKWKGY